MVLPVIRSEYGSSVTEARGIGARTSPMWFVGSALLLGGVVPVATVLWSDSSADGGNLLLGGGLVVLAACQLGWILGTARGEKFAAAMFWVFIYIFAALATLVQVGLGVYPLDNRTYPGDLVTAGLVHLWVGVIAYVVGGALWTSLSRKVDARKGGSRLPRQPLQFSQVKTIFIALVGLSAVVWKVWGYGVSAFFVSREQTTAILAGGPRTVGPFYTVEDKTGGLIATFLTQYLVFVALFVILYSRHYRLWERTRSQMLVSLFVIPPLIAANIIVNNPIGNGRWWSALILVGFVSIYFPYYRGTNIRIYVVGALVLLLFAFSSLDAFRFTEAGPAEASKSVTETLATDESYPVFQMHLNALEYIERHGYAGGEQLLGAVFGLVPRPLWEDKPIATGQIIDRYLRSTSLWTEGYFDFGIPGIVMLFLLFGAAVAWLSNAAQRTTPGFLHATFPLLAVLQLFVLRGSLLPSLGTAYQLLLAFALSAAWGQQRIKLPPRSLDPVEVGDATQHARVAHQ